MAIKRIAIIGAGAAGCFAAANMPHSNNIEVTVFEKTGKVLQKVKVSGGGRCNVTHAYTDVPGFADHYPRGKQLLRKSLYHFSPQDTIDWFEKRDVQLKTEADGRIFPITDSSQTIIDCIWQSMMRNNVQVLYHKSVERIEKATGGFTIHFADGAKHHADKILIATGGFPKPEQYKWLQQLGHNIQSPVPSLFTFNMPKHPITSLMGVSVPNVTIRIAGTKITESGPILITHWGLSGPVVLRTSAWAARALHDCNYEFQLQINWLNDMKEPGLRETIQLLRKDNGKQLIHYKNPFDLPKRLWEYLLQKCDIKETLKWGELPASAQNKIIESLIRDNYQIKGKTTFKEEFVTCGGIPLSEINPQTMESKIVPGIYFAGEIMDVDGITGGFNFQSAWTSAYIAAMGMIA